MNILKTYSITSDITAQMAKASKLHKEIVADGCITGFHSVSVAGDVLKILGDTLDNETDLDAVVLAHDGCSLDDYKNARYPGIDKKTKELISAGFTYDSETFSMSEQAQLNWKDLVNNTSWPKDISTLDHNTYSLTEANKDSFLTAYRAERDGLLDSGRDLQKSIFDATTKAEVDAVVDNR